MHTCFIYRMLRETFDLHRVRHFISAQLINRWFCTSVMAQE